MTLLLRLVGTVVLAAIGWALLGYVLLMPLGAIYGWSGHPALPAAPWGLYVGLYAVVLPLASLAAGWKLTRAIEVRLRRSGSQ